MEPVSGVVTAPSETSLITNEVPLKEAETLFGSRIILFPALVSLTTVR